MTEKKDFDFKKLAVEIEAATRKAFQEMVTDHADEGIYAFALYSDEGAMTVCPSTNTQEFLATAPQNDIVYYTFEPAEWRYEADGADAEFNEICSKLYDAIEGDFWDNPDESYEEEDSEDEDEEDEEFVEFQQTLYQTCIDVLLKLKQENFFNNLAGKDIFLMFSVTDYEYDRTKLREMITLLNDNPYRQEYLEWMKSWRNS